ncbi:MAG: histidinol-phosphate transaminase [Bacteroidota bacterium]
MKLKPYSSARAEFRGTASVFLDANENPYPSLYNRYPDPHQLALKKKIAILKNVKAEQIFLGNGSDEPIDLLIRAFCEPGLDNVLIPTPTYGMYTVSAEINAVEIRTVKLTSEFDIDQLATEGAWNNKTKLLFLCSPNNPTGNLLNKDRIESLLQRFSGLVIIDEAYIDFTDYAGFLPLLNRYNNLVVLQTLSKAWGLAGIRLGMCFSNVEVINVLNKIKPPYNINNLTQKIALESLEEVDRKENWVNEIKIQREFLRKGLDKTKLVIKVFPSDANFLLTKVKNAKAIYERLVAKGIITRDRSNVVLCDNCLRITVGTPVENRILLDELNKA